MIFLWGQERIHTQCEAYVETYRQVEHSLTCTFGAPSLPANEKRVCKFLNYITLHYLSSVAVLLVQRLHAFPPLTPTDNLYTRVKETISCAVLATIYNDKKYAGIRKVLHLTYLPSMTQEI